MIGKVKNIIEGRNYGFIRDEDHNEYFFHRDNFDGDWGELNRLIRFGEPPVEFDIKDSPKGLRADNVKLAVESV